MKKKLQIIGVFMLSLFMTAPFAYSQTDDQNQTNMDNVNSDTTEYHSKSYYNYAKKNIIEDTSASEEYEGKWTDSSKTATGNAENDEWNKSDKSMDEENTMDKGKKQMNKMKDSTKNKMNNMKNDAEEDMNNMKNDAKDNMNNMESDSTGNY